MYDTETLHGRRENISLIFSIPAWPQRSTRTSIPSLRRVVEYHVSNECTYTDLPSLLSSSKLSPLNGTLDSLWFHRAVELTKISHALFDLDAGGRRGPGYTPDRIHVNVEFISVVKFPEVPHEVR